VAKREIKCNWKFDGEAWEMSCNGEYFQFVDGGLKENNFTYCHNCGKKIKEKKPRQTSTGSGVKE